MLFTVGCYWEFRYIPLTTLDRQIFNGQKINNADNTVSDMYDEFPGILLNYFKFDLV